jgi:hypothetical protein
MADFPITRLSSLQIANLEDNSTNAQGQGGFGFAKMTEVQMNALTPMTLNGQVSMFKEGTVVYNTTANALYNCTAAPTTKKIGTWEAIGGGAGGGDVTGPGASKVENICIFSDEAGKMISDSGVAIGRVPAENSEAVGSEVKDANPIGFNNLGHVQFTGDVGAVYMNSDRVLQFFDHDIDAGSTVLITDDLDTGPTSIGAALEIRSEVGALLLPRMDDSQIEELSQPTNGMVVFNEPSQRLQVRQEDEFKTVITGIDTASNIGIGDDALSSIEVGVSKSNLAIGIRSLEKISGGDHDNLGIGYKSGANVALANQCTFIGAYADGPENYRITNSTAIGYGTKIYDDNTVILGTACNVGIGTFTPRESLHIAAVTDVDGFKDIEPAIYIDGRKSVPDTPTSGDGVLYVQGNSGRLFVKSNKAHSGPICVFAEGVNYGTSQLISGEVIIPLTVFFPTDAAVLVSKNITNRGDDRGVLAAVIGGNFNTLVVTSSDNNDSSTFTWMILG